MYRRALLLACPMMVLGFGTHWTWADTVRFAVTSDSRGDAGHSFALAAVNSVAGGPGEFIITSGDMDPLATTEAQIDAAFGVGFPWYPIIGNHEQERPADVAYLRDFYWTTLDGWVNPGPDGSTEMTYSFDAGPVHIVVVNVYWNGTTGAGADIARDGDVVPALRDWIAADLAASSQPWKLLFLHEPPFPQADEQWGDARHAGDSLDRYPPNRDAFWQMAEDSGAIACFVGHTHRYSSYRPLGSPVWQLDSGQARGTDEYDTFFIVEADDESLIVDVYRSVLSGGFLLFRETGADRSARRRTGELPAGCRRLRQHGGHVCARSVSRRGLLGSQPAQRGRRRRRGADTGAAPLREHHRRRCRTDPAGVADHLGCIEVLYD